MQLLGSSAATFVSTTSVDKYWIVYHDISYTLMVPEVRYDHHYYLVCLHTNKMSTYKTWEGRSWDFHCQFLLVVICVFPTMQLMNASAH